MGCSGTSSLHGIGKGEDGSACVTGCPSHVSLLPLFDHHPNPLRPPPPLKKREKKPFPQLAPCPLVCKIGSSVVGDDRVGCLPHAPGGCLVPFPKRQRFVARRPQPLSHAPGCVAGSSLWARASIRRRTPLSKNPKPSPGIKVRQAGPLDHGLTAQVARARTRQESVLAHLQQRGLAIRDGVHECEKTLHTDGADRVLFPAVWPPPVKWALSCRSACSGQ